MGKAARKLSGTALSEWRAKHPFDPATGRFVSSGGATAPSVPSTPTPGRARARLGLTAAPSPAATRTTKAQQAEAQRQRFKEDQEAIGRIATGGKPATLEEAQAFFAARGQTAVAPRNAAPKTAAQKREQAQELLRDTSGGLAESRIRIQKAHELSLAADRMDAAERGRARRALSGNREGNDLAAMRNVRTQDRFATLQREIMALEGAGTDGITQAENMLSGLTLPELKAFAATLGPTAKLPSKIAKGEAIRRIVDGTIGYRQRAEAIAPGVAARRAADRLRADVPSPATPAAPTRRAADTLRATQPAAPSATPRRSPNALLPNGWGGTPRPGSVHYHPDGAIGTAIEYMGDDKHMEIEGDALGNVLGRIATDTVLGRTSAQDQVARLKAVRDQVPLGSRARRELHSMVERLDVPRIDIDEWGRDVEPVLARFPVLRQLAQRLEAVPLARGADIPGDRADRRELDGLHKALTEFRQGTIGGGRFISAIERLDNQRHESREGKLEIDRAVQDTIEQLRNMQRADRTIFYPDTSGKA